MPRIPRAPAPRRAPARRRPAPPRGAGAAPGPAAGPLVRDAASRPAILVADTAPVLDAILLMRTHNVSGLPVVDRRGKVVGVLSQKDVARVVVGSPVFPEVRGLLDILLVRVSDPANASVDRQREALSRTPVSKLMSTPAVVVAPGVPLSRAAAIMRRRRFNRLPVVDDGRLLGVVARSDLLPHVVRAP